MTREEAHSKLTVQTNYHLDYDDLETIVKEVYGHNYSFVADYEASNYSNYDFNLDGNVDDEEDLQKFKDTGKYSYLYNDILNDLARNGYLPMGNLMVVVYW